MKNLQESIRNDIDKLKEEEDNNIVNYPVDQGDALQMLMDINNILAKWLDGAPEDGGQFFDPNTFGKVRESWFSLNEVIIEVLNRQKEMKKAEKAHTKEIMKKGYH